MNKPVFSGSLLHRTTNRTPSTAFISLITSEEIRKFSHLWLLAAQHTSMPANIHSKWASSISHNQKLPGPIFILPKSLILAWIHTSFHYVSEKWFSGDQYAWKSAVRYSAIGLHALKHDSWPWESKWPQEPGVSGTQSVTASTSLSSISNPTPKHSCNT